MNNDKIQEVDDNITALPCPFCGSVFNDVQSVKDGDLSDIACYVECADCKSQGPTCIYERTAIILWNNAKRG